ncbi:MAG: GNAT family N-acetyltransferase [Reichenbachiella sp.]|uniref:GNAT family N-acetyltransferase n=1 Tax=Reichenbachiella sp. TaxID=2184521 RepID=UPI003263EDA5
MEIVAAHVSDAIDLTDLTIRSKSYWDYSAEQINLWREDLTIHAKYILENGVFKLSNDNQLIGYYSHFPIINKTVKLDNLFIDPQFIKQGFGRVLLFDFMDRMKAVGVNKVTLDADPHAEAFYKKYDFITVGQKKTTIKNRFLPVMEREI